MPEFGVGVGLGVDMVWVCWAGTGVTADCIWPWIVSALDPIC